MPQFSKCNLVSTHGQGPFRPSGLPPAPVLINLNQLETYFNLDERKKGKLLQAIFSVYTGFQSFENFPKIFHCEHVIVFTSFSFIYSNFISENKYF